MTPSSEGSPPVRVAFQGARGAFSEEALVGYFGAGVEPLPCRDFAGVGAAVLGGEAAFGVLPVENTLAGSVQPAQDVLLEGELEIVDEIVIPIRHMLLGIAGARVAELRRIISHPVALAQCTRFLRSHPELEAVAVYDTAGAAADVAAGGDPTLAAIAPGAAAERYGLRVLAEDLQDRADNQTRFYVVKPRGTPDDVARPDLRQSRRSVLSVELEDRPGSLLALLAPFARAGVNLTRIESRPAATPWRYRFLIELASPSGGSSLDQALAEAARTVPVLLHLGSFTPATRHPVDLPGLLEPPEGC